MSVTAVVAGPDPERLAESLAALGATVRRVENPITSPRLDRAGIGTADLFVLTDIDEATSIAVAKDHNHELRVVVYSRDSVPEFARAQTDLAVDPELMATEVVAEELIGTPDG